MKRLSSLAACAAVSLGVPALLAQSTSPSAATSSSTAVPVAHVYVQYWPYPNANPARPMIAGYSADPPGG